MDVLEFITNFDSGKKRRPFVPADLSGMQAHFDAASIAQADNTAVAAWNDQSGNGRHLAQATGANQPTLQTNEINGKPVVRFDGTNDFLTLAAFTAIAVPSLVFVVVRPTLAIGRVFDFNNVILAPDAAGPTWRHFGGSAYVNSGLATSLGSSQILSVLFNGDGTSVIYKNGAGGAAGNNGSTSVTRYTLGAQSGGAGAYASMDLAELIHYRKAGGYTDAERRQVEAFLSAKYGIAVS